MNFPDKHYKYIMRIYQIHLISVIFTVIFCITSIYFKKILKEEIVFSLFLYITTLSILIYNKKIMFYFQTIFEKKSKRFLKKIFKDPEFI